MGHAVFLVMSFLSLGFCQTLGIVTGPPTPINLQSLKMWQMADGGAINAIRYGRISRNGHVAYIRGKLLDKNYTMGLCEISRHFEYMYY